MPTLDPAVAGDDYCYLSTTGRVTGRPHEIEIWFGLAGATLYMLSGGGDHSDWVKNLRAQPGCAVRIREQQFPGHARILDGGEEDTRARTLLVAKYQPRYSGNLEDWGRRSRVIAVDLETE
jgi:deazaflavin-dependent oxidoreductase (nitroreductase family)